MTNSSKSVFINRNTSHIKHGWQEKRMIMEYNASVSCALIGHNFPTVLQIMRCQTLVHIRTRLWDNILDNVNCFNEADLFGRSDKDIFEILLGKLWKTFDYASQEHCDFLCQVRRHIFDLIWII